MRYTNVLEKPVTPLPVASPVSIGGEKSLPPSIYRIVIGEINLRLT
jgi:hypothetical protein